MVFHLPYLEWFENNGYEVHVCANNDYENKEECNIPFCDEFYEVPFERSPLKKENIIAYKKLKRLINENKYDVIHCHTPIGGVLGRLAAKDVRKNGTKVIYTAHGFHFFKGAPLINWLLYYPVEKWLSKYTDCLITINDEDYEYAVRKKFKAGSVKKVNGVGIDLNKFTPQTVEKKKKLRKEYGYNENDFILIYVAEMSYRKHQDLLINTLNVLKSKIPNIKLLLVGTGNLLEKYKKQTKELSLGKHVYFLGYRKDIPNLMTIADVAVSSSRQEGLPVNVMEAMATGLPLVVTDCRGNRDLVRNGENGFVVGINDVNRFANSIEKLYNSKELRQQFGQKSLKIIKEYSLEVVKSEMEKIYKSFL
ncbi:Glycosyltransferase involved in cell wall bisynthesis [Anaerobranca californiensis DSM 14826]|uniref:Glycosyltransferase involved in cell wall bisynthesis n=1 Tax=Anaerobranca californiensis DSM 14826 TaxID=1120989 RepID=A0A1M6RJW0_9FIRM|nr:glycosyltransferase family 4 protein [Anaerobranca californiensis]SHK32648.1 Glycosyltransferase involved in cell wall bisynthesis [Anaerobranca californiensis DSM 14826]